MLYSCGTLAVFRYGKDLLQLRSSTLLSRKVETSDPSELNEKHLLVELGPVLGANANDSNSGTATPMEVEKKPFARPKGPARKR